MGDLAFKLTNEQIKSIESLIGGIGEFFEKLADVVDMCVLAIQEAMRYLGWRTTPRYRFAKVISKCTSTTMTDAWRVTRRLPWLARNAI